MHKWHTPLSLLLFFLTVGCAEREMIPTVVSSPLPFPPEFTEPKLPAFPLEEHAPPLTPCYGGNFLESPGVYTNGAWAFSWQACIIQAGGEKEEMRLTVNPRLSTARMVAQVIATIVYMGTADELLVGIESDTFGRLSKEPHPRRQTTVVWRDVPEGIYQVTAIATLRGKQKAVATQQVCYGVLEDCA